MPVPPLAQLHALTHPPAITRGLSDPRNRPRCENERPTLRPLLLLSRAAVEGHLAPECADVVVAPLSRPPSSWSRLPT